MLGEVDLVAAEHGVDARAKPRLVRQREQELECLRRDPVLGVVEVNAGRLEAEPFGARRILAEQLAQVPVANQRRV